MSGKTRRLLDQNQVSFRLFRPLKIKERLTSRRPEEGYKDGSGIQLDVVPVEIVFDVSFKGVDGSGYVVAGRVARGTTSHVRVERGGHREGEVAKGWFVEIW